MQFDLGFIGGGQLARMSIQAAQRMGLLCVSLDPAETCPAGFVAPCMEAKLDDVEALEHLLRNCARVTLENEFVPASALREALERSERTPDTIIPGIETLEIIQDKLLQRQALASAGVPGPVALPLEEDAALAIAKLGLPLILKSRKGGYDGKGVLLLRNADEVELHRTTWSSGGWMAEAFVPFKRELAVMVVRTPHQTFCFPTMETIQEDHVCSVVFPAGVDASQIAVDAVVAVKGYGLFGVELFELENGEFWVNEIAPRPHNTGHYTLDWGQLSQFEAHIRACFDLPMEPPHDAEACMVNLLGQRGAREWRRGLSRAMEAVPSCHVHWYGKAESKLGRKMGHINGVGVDARARAEAARVAFYEGWRSRDGE